MFGGTDARSNGSGSDHSRKLEGLGITAGQFKKTGAALSEFLSAEYAVLAPHLARESSILLTSILLALAGAALVLLGVLALLVTILLLGLTFWPDIPMIGVFGIAAFMLISGALVIRHWAIRRLLLQDDRLKQLWRVLRVRWQ